MESFQTVRKLSRLFRNFPKCLQSLNYPQLEDPHLECKHLDWRTFLLGSVSSLAMFQLETCLAWLCHLSRFSIFRSRLLFVAACSNSCEKRIATVTYFPNFLLLLNNALNEMVTSSALCCYPHLKLEMGILSQITTTAPIFLQFNYFRENIWVQFHFFLHICRTS